MYRRPEIAPAESVDPERRGPAVGRFCRACGSVYPGNAARHAGKPVYGKDHVSAPCSNEGREFRDGAGWWASAVRVLPEAP